MGSKSATKPTMPKPHRGDEPGRPAPDQIPPSAAALTVNHRAGAARFVCAQYTMAARLTPRREGHGGGAGPASGGHSSPEFGAMPDADTRAWRQCGKVHLCAGTVPGSGRESIVSAGGGAAADIGSGRIYGRLCRPVWTLRTRVRTRLRPVPATDAVSGRCWGLVSLGRSRCCDPAPDSSCRALLRRSILCGRCTFLSVLMVLSFLLVYFVSVCAVCRTWAEIEKGELSPPAHLHLARP